MADNRKTYIVTINGIEHEMLLTDEDAKTLYGENATVKAKAGAPANKAGTAANKSGSAVESA